MKTTILLMFSFFLITGSLLGQTDKFNYLDSDIKKQFSPFIKPNSPRLSRPKFNILRDFDYPAKRNLDRFDLYQDSSFQDYFGVRRYPDFVIVEEYPGSSRYYGNPFIIKPDTRGILLIKKPDKSVKNYLIIQDPIRHTITR